jgi:hypothetical protein
MMKIKQYQNPQYTTSKSDRMIWYILAVVFVAVAIVAIFFFFQKPPEAKIICGDKVCDQTENCYDCAVDCKCNSNEYCPKETKKCTRPTCGNGKCEPFESPENCCDDCKCTIPGEVCNQTIHICESQIQITDERVKQLITEFYQRQGVTVISISVTGPGEYQDKLGKQADVTIEGQRWMNHLLVTDSGEVIETIAP